MRKCLLSVLVLVLCSASLGAQSFMGLESEQLEELWLNYDRISTELSILFQEQEIDLGELVGRVQILTTELEVLKAELRDWRIELTELQTLSQTLADESRRLESDIQLLSASLKSFSEQYGLLETQVSALQVGHSRMSWVAGISAAVAVASVVLFLVLRNP